MRCRPSCAPCAAKSSCCRTRARGGKTQYAQPVRRSREAPGGAGDAGRSRRRQCRIRGRAARRRRSASGGQNRRATTPPSTRSRAADYEQAIAGFRNFWSHLSGQRAREQRAVLARRGYYVTRDIDERHHGLPEGDHRLAGFAQGAGCAGEDRLHAVGAGHAMATRASRWRTWCARIRAPRPRSSRANRLKRLPAEWQMNAGSGRRDGRAIPRRLKITEIFYSLQGEADTVGFPTVFVRLTGCPLRCQYCDTAYAFHGGEWMTLEQSPRARGRVHGRATCASPAANRWRRRTACRCSAGSATPATACRSRPAAPCHWRRRRARDPRRGREDAGLGRRAPQSLRRARAAAPRRADQVRDLRSRRLRVEPRRRSRELDTRTSAATCCSRPAPSNCRRASSPTGSSRTACRCASSSSFTRCSGATFPGK